MSSDENQFDVLQESEGKQQRWEGRNHHSQKDDMKAQSFEAREGFKQQVTNLKEKVVNSDLYEKVTDGLQKGIELAKEKVGMAGATNEEVVDEIKDQAAGEWETVKRKGRYNLRKAENAVNEKLDENLTEEQRAKLDKGLRQAKRGAIKLERKAEGFSNKFVNLTMRSPQLRPVKSFIQRNNLQLPFMIFSFFITLWFGLTLIRMLTQLTQPAVPEFDIHSRENSLNWLKYHAGEYKDKAMDMKESISARAAAFLANHEWEKLKDQAIDWKDIGMKKLGLTEPTWSETIYAYATGRPITWQGRVESVLNLAKDGINKVDLNAYGIKDKLTDAGDDLVSRIRHALNREPTLGENIRDHIPGLHREGFVEGVKNRIQDGVDSINRHIPGTGSYEAAKQAAYEATHPSTLDNIKSGATYIKNRIVHGAQEVVHNVQDRTNEAVDKAKYKTGL